MGLDLVAKLVVSLVSASAGAGMLAGGINNTTVTWLCVAVGAWIVFAFLKLAFLWMEKYHKPLILLLTGSNVLMVWLHWFVK